MFNLGRKNMPTQKKENISPTTILLDAGGFIECPIGECQALIQAADECFSPLDQIWLGKKNGYHFLARFNKVDDGLAISERPISVIAEFGKDVFVHTLDIDIDADWKLKRTVHRAGADAQKKLKSGAFDSVQLFDGDLQAADQFTATITRCLIDGWMSRINSDYLGDILRSTIGTCASDHSEVAYEGIRIVAKKDETDLSRSWFVEDFDTDMLYPTILRVMAEHHRNAYSDRG